MANYPELSGKVVLISGAGGNLGSAVVKRLNREGVKLAIIDRDENAARGRLQADDIDERNVMIGVVDLLKRQEVEAFVHRVAQWMGGIDIVLNIAGGYKPQPPIHEMTDDLFDFLLNLNLKTVFHLSSIAAKQMVSSNRGGRIINVAARAALKGDPGNAAYSASKAAVIRLTESMAAELLDKNITVNAVLPSVLDTPQNRAGSPNEDYSRWVSVESLADVIAFLASDSARDISGAAIPVYGKS
ncbi:MAG: SDR family oxidoreductase [Anaerolineae bacterium]|nr:SDR family oxidoreductase [Anaerolineae bacterium]